MKTAIVNGLEISPEAVHFELDRLAKEAKMWSARSYGNGAIASAPLPLRIIGKALDALAQLFWPAGTPGCVSYG